MVVYGYEIKKKVAVVVGSSRGLGLEIAKGFKEEGAIVIITYLKNKKLAKKQFFKAWTFLIV